MLDFLDRVNWDQTYAFLVSGRPPIFVRLMLLNAVFMAIYGVRKAAGANPMPIALALFLQLLVLAANLVVLYQMEVLDYLNTLMERLY